MSRIQGWSKLSARELWEQWRTQFADEQEAVAVAIWTANRLVKDRARSTRRKFYSIKDAWVKRNQEHLVAGYKVRLEKLECNRCVSGKVPYLVSGDEWAFFGWAEDGCLGDPPEGVKVRWERCDKCGGTSVYRQWWLYLHVFDVGGQRYSFHSYEEPSRLVDEKGEDCEFYGGRFTDNELAELALPVSGLVRLLGYVAAAIWGLSFDRHDGRYYDPWALLRGSNGS